MRPNPRPSWRGHRPLAVVLDEIAMFEDEEPVEDVVAAYGPGPHPRTHPPTTSSPPGEKEKDMNLQPTVRPEDIRAWRLCVEYATEIKLGSFNWPFVVGRLLDEVERLQEENRTLHR